MSFEKELALNMAVESMKNPVIAKQIAAKVVENHELFDKVIDKIDIGILSKAMAHEIIEYTHHRGHGKHTSKFGNIMSKAEDMAAEALSKAILQDTRLA